MFEELAGAEEGALMARFFSPLGAFLAACGRDSPPSPAQPPIGATRHSVGVDRTLPREEFFYRQLVSSANFLKAYHASAHSVDDYGLAPGYPAFCIGGRQVEVAILRAGAMQRRRVFI